MVSYPLTLPIGDAKPLATLHHPNKALWELEMHNGKDNRLTSFFLMNVLRKALDTIEKDWRGYAEADGQMGAPGALIISGKQDQQKFFSNGMFGLALDRRY